MHSRQSRRTRIILALALAIVLAGLLWPSRARRRAVVAAAEPQGPTATLAPVMPAAPAEPPARPKTAAAPPRAPEAPPIIDEVTVEKPAVCSGEDNLVTVRAHTANGTDEFLHYVVDGAMGSSVPLRLLLGEDGRVEGQHVISVFGRTNVAVTVPVPAYEVKDCQPARVVVIEPRVAANTWSDFDFLAKVVTLPPPGPGVRSEGSRGAFTPVSYSWSFGDGDAATTSGPAVSHDYERRAQDSLYSYFPVRVDVRDAGGEVLTGRTTLPLINQAFEAFAQKGIVQLLIALAPRFPELGPDGRVVQNVRLWHTRSEPVTIDAVTLTRYFEGASGETRPQALDVAALLGATTVPPGKDGITTSVTLDTITDPGVFSSTYRLSGHSADGHPVMGSFSVMRPPARPTADNSQAVIDPMLKARIVAARQMLGKDTVNDEELWQLERQGRFADVAPASDAPVGDAPASALPASAPPGPVSPPVRPPAMPGVGLPTRGPPVPAGVTPAPTVTAPESGRGTGDDPGKK
jgi:PKD domain